MATDIETVVIGAGVIGLAVARALAEAGQEVMVLERHDRIGSEISARNSEVIHAGIYYPPGSIRARLCVQGRRQLYDFAIERGVPFSCCGKLLLAAQASEARQLELISANAAASGVAAIPLSRSDAQHLEPEIECVAALFLPSSGIIDAHALMLALEGSINSLNGQIVLNSTVIGLSVDPAGNFAITTLSSPDDAPSASTITARNLVIAAGLGAQEIGAALHSRRGSTYAPPPLYPAKAHYYALKGRSPFRHLIYPVPADGGLGIHLTLDMAGQARFGPDIAWTNGIDFAFDDNSFRCSTFERAIRRYWPGLPDDALEPGYTGIRPKIHAAGTPTVDFAIHGPAIHGVPRLVGLYGVESPGLTSCLAIAGEVASLLG